MPEVTIESVLLYAAQNTNAVFRAKISSADVMAKKAHSIKNNLVVLYLR